MEAAITYNKQRYTLNMHAEIQIVFSPQIIYIFIPEEKRNIYLVRCRTSKKI